MVIQCCVCHSVRIEDKWQSKTVKDGQQVSHTYCPRCLKEESAALVADRKRTLALT